MVKLYSNFFSSKIEKSSLSVRAMSGAAYKTLAVTQPLPFVNHVELNRPDKLNAFSNTLFL